MRNTKILVVDDSLVMRLKIEDTLKELPNVEILQAKDGEEALLMIEKEQPDGMILDSLMPKLDGYGVLKKLKAAKSPLRVIVLTADIQHTTKQKYSDMGALDVLNKPFSNQELLQSVQLNIGVSNKS